MSNQLSKADQTYLSETQQAQIKALKQAWAEANAAGDQQAMDRANQQAEAIRAASGYAGGSDGSGYMKISGDGKTDSVPEGAGQSAQQVQQWVDDYRYTNLDSRDGWVNGFSAAMNLRSMANYIRQQMQANAQAWNTADEAGRAYLHDQNQQLARILEQNNGGAKSTYNEELGRWETDDANLGYGYNVGQYKDLDWYRGFYGMTDEQIEQYRNDTSRYRNFVDQSLVRSWVDESSGYTGRYSQFANGPHSALLSGSGATNVNPEVYEDVEGDGFNETPYEIPLDEQGRLTPRVPQIKDNNGMTDYTRSKASYVDENGVIRPGSLLQSNPAGGRRNSTEQIDHPTLVLQQDGGSGMNDALEQWRQASTLRALAGRDHAVDAAVQQLLDAQAKAEASYQSQRDQIAREERNALDNSALYAETRGDRGGIGQTQYNQIQATAAANRQLVSAAQSQLAADTARQIAQLRADGEFEKADDLLEISQTYLLKLLELEKWAAEYELDTAKFEASVQQWEQEFLLQAAKALM